MSRSMDVRARLDRHRIRHAAAAAVLAFALTACGLLGGGAVPELAYYRLSAAPDAPARASGPLPGAADVPPFRADGLMNDRPILYRKGGSNVAAYNYHSWWEAPGTMLQDSLIDALRRAKAFELVTAPDLRLDRTWEIVGRIRRFEQDGATVHVEVELMLRLVRSGAPVLLKTYTQDVQAADETVPAAVNAFSTAVGAIWTQFIMDLGSVTPPSGKEPPPKS